MTEQELRRALRSLSDELSAESRRAVLQKIRKKERPVVKNKLSVAIIATIVLMLLSTVALAVTLSREYFEDVAKLQFESGYYMDWDLKEKKAMVAILQEYGFISEHEAAEMDNESAIDAYMIARYGVEGSDRIDTIGLYSILETELGLMQTWSLEQRAWYSDMMMRTGLLKRGGEEGIFGVPEEQDIQPDEAVAIAKSAIIKAFNLPENALDGHRIDLSFETDSNDWERKNLFYIINFWGEEYYWCNVTRNGQIIDSTMDKYSLSPAEQVERKRKQAQDAAALASAHPEGRYEKWSLPDKAKWLGADNGIPRVDDITETEAVAIATRRLHDIGYDLPEHEVSVWYKVQDYYGADDSLQKPCYVVYFIDDLEAPREVFSVTIDAASGEILQTYTPDRSPSNG